MPEFPQNFIFREEGRIESQRLSSILPAWEKLLEDLTIDIDITKSDSITIHAAKTASESEVAKTLDRFFQVILKEPSDHEKIEFILSHGPIHAYINRARELADTKSQDDLNTKGLL